LAFELMHIESSHPNGLSPPWFNKEPTPGARRQKNPNIWNNIGTKNVTYQREEHLK
jgi:hypothetical protein